MLSMLVSKLARRRMPRMDVTCSAIRLGRAVATMDVWSEETEAV